MDDKLTKNSEDIALLTRKERSWLLGKIEASNARKEIFFIG
jgi:hypothetical protein